MGCEGLRGLQLSRDALGTLGPSRGYKTIGPPLTTVVDLSRAENVFDHAPLSFVSSIEHSHFFTSSDRIFLPLASPFDCIWSRG